MGVKRNKEEIIADILEAIDNKINRISSIMKNVNLSASVAKKYLDTLMKSRLIEEKKWRIYTYGQRKRSSRTFKGEEKIRSRISTAIKRDNEAYRVAHNFSSASSRVV